MNGIADVPEPMYAHDSSEGAQECSPGASRAGDHARGNQPQRGERVQPMAQAMGKLEEKRSSAPKGAKEAGPQSVRNAITFATSAE
jgi:hypothetical protein